MISDNELKCCPHCGGAAFLSQTYSQRSHVYIICVKCSVCGSQGKAYFSKIDPEYADFENDPYIPAIEAWNMRVSSKCSRQKHSS